MKKKFPWWLKILIKILSSRLPLSYGFWKAMGVFEHGQMNNFQYSIDNFFNHLKRLSIEGDDLRGFTILEMGPGDSIATAIIASCFGARTTLIDAGEFIHKDMKVYSEFISFLGEQGYNTKHMQKCQTYKDLVRCSSTTYLTDGLKSFRGLDDSSIDVIFSQAVLEHIKLDEFEDTIKETRRVLNSRGIASHQIDLKDHLSKSLNNLRFSREIWESSIFSNSGFYTNRLRYSSIIETFENIGFTVAIDQVKRWEKLPLSRSKMQLEFSILDDAELLIKDFSVTLK